MPGLRARSARRRLSIVAVALSAAVAVACSGDGLVVDPGLPAPSDPELLQRAVVLDIDLVSGTVRVRTPHPAPRLAGGPLTPSFALLGGNEVGVTTGNFVRTPHPREAVMDDISFDVTLTNRLLGAGLVNPTFPAPPLAQGIFLIPFAATVTPNVGRAWATKDWDGNGSTGSGAPFNFFNDQACSNDITSDCFRWEAFPTLGPGATSAAQRVGFTLRNVVTSLTVYMIVSADIRELPVGAIRGVVSTQQGPLAGAVVSAGSATSTTDGAGIYTLIQVPAGQASVSLTLSGPAASCPDPGPLPVTVVGGQVAVLDIALPCSPFIGPPPVILTTSLPAATYGTAYSAQLAGTPSPLTWQALSNVPPGFQLDATGKVTGTPTNPGSFSFTVLASDAFGQSASGQVSINILAAPNDQFEPNNSLGGADNLGTVLSNGITLSITPTISSPSDVDFFRIHLQEAAGGTCTGVQTFSLSVALSIPAGLDLDLFLYNLTGTVLGSSGARSGTTEVINRTFTGNCAAQDSFDVVVEVRRFTGLNTAPYSLFVTYR